MPPESSRHGHFPSSRAQTARLTAAGMWPGFLEGREFVCGFFTSPLRLACCASRRSSAASSTCSAEAPGCACPCPFLAVSSLSRNCLETVMCRRHRRGGVLGANGQRRFIWMKRRRARDLGHHLPPRNHLGRADLDRDGLRLLLRPVEELRDDLGAVLGSDHPGQFHHAGDAEPSVPQGPDHLGEPLAELHPEPLPVELRQRHQKIGHGTVLAAEEIGEATGRFACVVNARIFSRVFTTAPNARDRFLARFRARPSRTPPESAGALQ
jgi:hypothetical protein